MGFFSSLFGIGDPNIQKLKAEKKQNYMKKYGDPLFHFADGTDLFFDKNTEKLIFETYYPKDKMLQHSGCIIYDIKQYMHYEININDTIINESNGAIMRGLVGGVLFGAVGAIAGAASANTTQKTKIKNGDLVLFFDDFDQPCMKFGLKLFNVYSDSSIAQKEFYQINELVRKLNYLYQHRKGN